MSDLEARWRLDRSPRIFLQLADELRRSGGLERAITVLREGLEHHPDSISGRVALGRAQLEAGDAAGAAESLELAVARDPAQIVASKLLIEAWIRTGDASRARERLDIYRILHERDGEIEELERRIATMERAERASAVHELIAATERSEEQPQPLEAPLGTDSSEPAPTPPIFDLSRSTPSADPAGLDAALRQSRETVRGAVGGSAPADGFASPFGRVHEPEAASARILDFFRREGVFGAFRHQAARAAPVVASEPVAEVAERAETAPADSPVTAGPAPAESPESVLESAVAIEGEVRVESIAPPQTGDVAEEVEVPDAAERTYLQPATESRKYSTTGYAAEVESEILAEEAEAVESAEAPSEAASAPEDVVAASALAPVSPGDRPASATLGRLFLDQGHLDDAEAAFRRVLELRPDDAAALSGLEDVSRRRAGEETEAGWAATVSASGDRSARPAGLSRKKIETLRRYLTQIRRARARANVS